MWAARTRLGGGSMLPQRKWAGGCSPCLINVLPKFRFAAQGLHVLSVKVGPAPGHALIKQVCDPATEKLATTLCVIPLGRPSPGSFDERPPRAP